MKSKNKIKDPKTEQKSSKLSKSLKKGWLDSKTNPSKLRIARKEAGITQAQIAKKLKITPQGYKSIEKATVRVTEKRADVITKLIGQNNKLDFFKYNEEKAMFVAIK